MGAASTRPASSSTRRCPPTTAPYGIQTVGNRIFVTYAEHVPGAADEELPGAGKGYVSAFDFAGNFLARVASGGVLNAPWGIAMADPNFGAFGGDLLIGNFGDGRINAFHENADGTWTPSGTLKALDGQPLVDRRPVGDPVRLRRRQQRPAQPPVLHRRPERRDRRACSAASSRTRARRAAPSRRRSR